MAFIGLSAKSLLFKPTKRQTRGAVRCMHDEHNRQMYTSKKMLLFPLFFFPFGSFNWP